MPFGERKASVCKCMRYVAGERITLGGVHHVPAVACCARVAVMYRTRVDLDRSCRGLYNQIC